MTSSGQKLVDEIGAKDLFGAKKLLRDNLIESKMAASDFLGSQTSPFSFSSDQNRVDWSDKINFFDSSPVSV